MFAVLYSNLEPDTPLFHLHMNQNATDHIRQIHFHSTRESQRRHCLLRSVHSNSIRLLFNLLLNGKTQFFSYINFGPLRLFPDIPVNTRNSTSELVAEKPLHTHLFIYILHIKLVINNNGGHCAFLILGMRLRHTVCVQTLLRSDKTNDSMLLMSGTSGGLFGQRA